MWIPRYWFNRIESQYRTLIWKSGVARIKLSTLQYPKELGGMAVPHSFYILFGCAVAAPFCVGPAGNARPLQDIADLEEYATMSQLEMGIPAALPECPTVQLIAKLWKEIKKRMGMTGFLACTPIWRNSSYPEFDQNPWLLSMAEGWN